jgi:hypothetical protein
MNHHIFIINKIDLISGKLLETCRWDFKEDAYKDFDEKSDLMEIDTIMVLIRDNRKSKKIISQRQRT